MKKLFSLAISLFCAILVYGQMPEMQMKITIKPGDNVKGKIIKNDGTTESVNLEGILILDPDAFSRMEFEYKSLPDCLQHVLLTEGSNIEWATINFGATSEEDAGKLYEWPDEDVVYNVWSAPYVSKGYKWRLPTYQELRELIACGWEEGEKNGVSGFWVYNKEDEQKPLEERRKIFLPVTGVVDGVAEGNYWSSTSTNIADMAWCMTFKPSKEQEDKIGSKSKSYKLAIRPVWGDPNITATMSAAHSSVTYQGATISLSLVSDDAITIDSYGVRVSQAVDSENHLVDPMIFKGTGVLTKDASASVVVCSTPQQPIEPNTTYYYQAYAVLKMGGVIESEVSETSKFTTKAKMLNIGFGEITATSNSASIQVEICGDALSELSYGVRYALTRDSLNRTDVNVVKGSGTLNGSPVSMQLINLVPDATYYIRAYAEGGGRSMTADNEFKTLRISKFKEPTKIVDLGLSVKWANFNLGATSETEKGGRYGWGDISGDSTNIWPSNYAPGLYNTSIAGDEQYDIVAANLGGNWRMPTVAELEELNQCRWVYTSNYNNSGLVGYVIYGIGAYQDQYIFVPYAGYRRGTEVVQDNNAAYWWSSEVNGAGDAIYMQMSGMATPLEVAKSFGMSVRPVYDDGQGPEPVVNLDPTKPKTEKASDGSLIPQTGVDMGLPSGTKWANWNLGATSTTGATGKYYAFGELTDKEIYTDNLYTFKKDGEHINGDDSDYFTNGVLNKEYDAACQLWGDDWRMPTEDQIDELIMNSTAEWKDNYHGQRGFLFTSMYNGNSVFLPALGSINGESNYDFGTFGCYWSCSKCTSTTDKRFTHAMQMLFSREYGSSTTSDYRYKGCTIRPVMPKK